MPRQGSSSIMRLRASRPRIGFCIQWPRLPESLGVETLTVVADAGYSNGAAAACEADGITPSIPANRSVNNQGDGRLFGRSAFVWQAETGSYLCPGRPTPTAQADRAPRSLLHYAPTDCYGCVLKPRCTTAARRFVTRLPRAQAFALYPWIGYDQRRVEP